MSPEHRFPFLRENWYRDVWLVLVTALVLWATVVSHNTQTQQREGRKVSLTATCAAISGVIEAGRATILGGVIIRPKEFERTLTKMGLPSFPVRKRSADAAAAAYGHAIAMRVEQATHRKGLARKDGTLDCDAIRQVGRAK
jgi:hypothetical protein